MLKRKQQTRTIHSTIHVTCRPCVVTLFGGVSFAHRYMVEVVTARSFSDKFPPLGVSSTFDRTSSKVLCAWIHLSSRVAFSAINHWRPPSFTSFVSSTSQSSSVEFRRMLKLAQTYSTTGADRTMTTYAADIDPILHIVASFHQKS